VGGIRSGIRFGFIWDYFRYSERFHLSIRIGFISDSFEFESPEQFHPNSSILPHKSNVYGESQ